jgi:hypothetical protein
MFLDSGKVAFPACTTWNSAITKSRFLEPDCSPVFNVQKHQMTELCRTILPVAAVAQW